MDVGCHNIAGSSSGYPGLDAIAGILVAGGIHTGFQNAGMEFSLHGAGDRVSERKDEGSVLICPDLDGSSILTYQ
jgi:hypothetical protein